MPRQAQARPAVAMALPTPGSTRATQTSTGRAEGVGGRGQCDPWLSVCGPRWKQIVGILKKIQLCGSYCSSTILIICLLAFIFRL